MCGIAGWLSEKINKDTCSKILTRLISITDPDSFSQWSIEGVWLGHRRLAVLEFVFSGSSAYGLFV